MEKQAIEKNHHLVSGQVDISSVLTSLGVMKASLEIVHDLYNDGGLDNTDKMFAAAQITKHALAEAVEDIETAMEAINTIA
jgi:hypothetical protein